MENWDRIITENRNPATESIDTLPTEEMLRLINREDSRVAPAVGKEIPVIAKAVDAIAGALAAGHRLIYSGCGTSGRLGVLDAAECPPTFSADPGQVVGLIAGGERAMFRAVEGAEDDPDLGAKDLERIGFCSGDVLVGLSASGRTPYVIGAVRHAKRIGAVTVTVSCCPGSPLYELADIPIAPEPGPEVITGSTRMKSGTAQKLVLNMLSTGAMIRLGKTYGNLMVDVMPSNEKLIRRCRRIVCEAAGVREDEASAALDACGYRPKTAILMLLCGVDAQEADRLLALGKGRISAAIQSHES